MLCTALVALDSTVIATAVPTVVKDLGGFSQFPWLFSLYLLTQAVTVPVYGKLADLYGRKPMLTFGVAMFVLGSLLCGLAWSMPVLIASRAVQGIGAGAITPIGVTILGDLYTLEERARVQGYNASVWGMASVAGPALGGLVSDYLSWRWIFLINLPLGAVALFALRTRFHEQVHRREHVIDYRGVALLTTGCSLLVLGLLEGGHAWAWRSGTSAVVLGSALVLLVGFVLVERRAAEPVLPLWVLRHRVLVACNLAAVGVGALLIGASSYVPTYAQGVLGTSAVVAGFAFGALTVGWPIAATLSGRVYLRLGFRDTALIGVGFAVVGTLMATQLSSHASVWQVAAAMFVTGIGMGLSSSPLVVAIQSVVGYDRRGVVTGANMFFRSIGSALGVAVYGALANSTIANRFAHPPAGMTGPVPHSVDGTTQALAHGGAVASFARSALYDATHHVFVAVAVTAGLIALAVALVPRRTAPI
jgi:EmrB/QacA subfamily drug resistance transporter